MQASTKVTHRSANAASGNPVAILAFSGDIASSSKEAILNAYHTITPSLNNVLLDFTGVDYINSSGIAIIIQLLMEAGKSNGRKIGLFGLTPHFKKVFTMVGVGKYAHISANESEALAAL